MPKASARSADHAPARPGSVVDSRTGSDIQYDDVSIRGYRADSGEWSNENSSRESSTICDSSWKTSSKTSVLTSAQPVNHTGNTADTANIINTECKRVTRNDPFI